MSRKIWTAAAMAKARAASLTKKERTAIAQRAARARWAKPRKGTKKKRAA